MPKMRLALHPRNAITVTICPMYRFMLLGRISDFQRCLYNKDEIRQFEDEFLYRCTSCRVLLHSAYGCQHIELADSPYWELKCDFWDGYHYICSTSDLLHRRAHLINETLVFLLKYVISSPNTRSKMESCFRVAWRVNHHPYVRVQEIKELFKFKNCLGRCKRKCLEYVQFSCQVYEKCFSIASGPTKPRSLRHLSRCEVRRALIKSNSWPNGAKVLELPTILKEYVQLKC